MIIVRDVSVILMVLPSLCAPLSLAPAFGAAPPSRNDIVPMETRVVESRKNIRSGRVVVDVRHTVSTRDPESLDHGCRYTVYFKTDSLRCDTEVESARGKGVRQSVSTSKTFIRVDSPDHWVQVFGPTTRPKSATEIPDARLLGLVPWTFGTISQFGYETQLLRPDRDQFEIQAGTEDNEPIWKIRYRITGLRWPVFGEYWIAPRMGGMPILIDLWRGEGEQFVKESIKTKLRRYDNGGVWFPKEVVYRHFKGTKLTEEEIDTVEEAHFNEEMPDETFTLAGLGLPKGRIVSVDNELMVWTGEQLRPKILGEDDSHVAIAGPEPSSPFRRWVLVVNSMVLACIAAWLLWYYWRRKSSVRETKGQ